MRWTVRPSGSNWGEFGPDDQLGTLNYIGKEQVLAASNEIREGLSFCLSMPLDMPGGNVLNVRRYPPVLRPTKKGDQEYINYPFSNIEDGAIDVVSDDEVTLSLQYSTQWDSLAHVGAKFDANDDGIEELVYYNGFAANTDILGPNQLCCGGKAKLGGSSHRSRALALGVDVIAKKGLQGRGTLIDLARHFGRERRAVGYEDLAMVLKEDSIDVRRGDILLLRTGFAELVVEMDGSPDINILNVSCCALDGRDKRLLEWITETGVAAIAADNYAVECYPLPPVAGPHPMMPLHHHCLFKLGLPLGELWYLHDLAEWLQHNDRRHCMLTAPPLRLPGAIGSPVTPVATV